MWRFLLAGLATVGGLILWVLAFLGDPVATLHDQRTAIPVTASPVGQTETLPRAISAQQIKTAQDADMGTAGMDATAVSTQVSAPIVTRPLDRVPIGYNDDGTAANTLISGIQSGPARAPVRNAGSSAMTHSGRATHTYVTRSQHQGVWLFPPDQLGGGGH
jgi:hypothetical protein